uniref:Abnormal cell migration protein 18-like fibronectin type I domain-containing protein n=2 Tax=Parascaris TaxID=6254 RepID=A0A915CIQ3_PARUN
MEMLLLILTVIVFVCVNAQRSMVLTSWTGSGSHNVRYATVSTNFRDANGDVVPNKSLPRRLPDGSTVYDCTDLMGRTRKSGDEYERPNARFKYRCDNGIERIVACIGSERSGKAIIKVGTTFMNDGFWHKCTHFPKNETANYTEEPECRVKDKRYHVGDDIRSAFFLMKCEEDGYKIVGCYYRGSNKELIKMEPGTTVDVEGITHHCDDNEGNIQYYTTASECTKNNRIYKEGERFKANHLNYECSRGIVETIGCYINEQRDLRVNEDVIENNMVYKCYKRAGVIHYEEYACGFRGMPACSPQPVGAIADEKDSLQRGLKPPGFGSFSIVQHVQRGSNKMATGSETVKLEVPVTAGFISQP